MHEIKLIQLTLEYFKGIRAKTVRFAGENASIYGDNATGKTTIYDAWLWLLTGKDSLGRADFDIKPLDRLGNVADHAARSCAEALLEADGQTVTLRREFYELWTKKRGSTEATFDGNSTDFFVDGVPKQKRGYEEAVAELVPPDKLRLLSDTAAFAAMKWQDRRAVLCEMAGIGDDRGLMREDPEFAPLLEAMGRGSLDDLRARLRASRRKQNARLNDLPVMIAENQKIAEGLRTADFDALRASLSDLEEDEHRLTAAIAAGEQGDLRTLEAAVEAAEQETARLELENRRYRMDQEAAAPDRRGMEDGLRRAERDTGRLEEQLRQALRRYRSDKEDAEASAGEAERFRRSWAAENARSYDGTDLCPTCGQALPEKLRREARETFSRQKTERLKEIQAMGSRAAERTRGAERRLEEDKDAAARLEGELALAKEEADRLRAALEAAEAPVILDMPDYAEKRKEAAERAAKAREALLAARDDSRAQTDDLRRKRMALRGEMDRIRELLAKETVLQATKQRIAELTRERRTLADGLAELDRLGDLADCFLRCKAERVTERVNGMFRLASFRLFQEQVNGALADCCDILCGGVPYDRGLNNGARINVGLDILRTMQQRTGYRVPVFVDNAEAITAMEPIETQVIRLVVSEQDKEVRIA